MPTGEPSLPVESPTPTSAPEPTVAEESGALIQMSFQSQVGILVDGVPATQREELISQALAQSDQAWLELAKRQAWLTRLRLNFRGFGIDGLGQLPLTPEALWQIELDGADPQLATIDGHELILIGYTFNTTILTDILSPAIVEPALGEIGGVWLEPFIFPADPDLLTQRTGNACINEAGFPPNSFDSQNYRYLYDFGCTALSGGALGCHRTSLPNYSCEEALDLFIGSVPVDIRFERLMWDPELADTVRIGANSPGSLPDLSVVAEELEINRIAYRWFPPEDCALQEDAVSGSGWRRILQFNATVYNESDTTLEIGRVSEIDVFHNVFEYSPCHDHFHYSNYGAFDLVDFALPFSSKKAFCVQSTSRFSNNESSPLHHEYSCTDQGIQAGWVDEYIAGLDVQWVDITDLTIPEEGLTVALGFSSNADGFIYEGEPILDEEGEQLWQPSGFFTPEGAEINRPLCQFVEDWDHNNYAETNVFVPPSGSFVTGPCETLAFGPLRDCGFTEVTEEEGVCTPDSAVEYAVPQNEGGVYRVCERSAFLGGLACSFNDSVVSTYAEAGETISFTCPTVRDGAAGAGGFSLYWAPNVAAPGG